MLEFERDEMAAAIPGAASQTSGSRGAPAGPTPTRSVTADREGLIVVLSRRNRSAQGLLSASARGALDHPGAGRDTSWLRPPPPSNGWRRDPRGFAFSLAKLANRLGR